jgi:hypothetical protein
MRKYTLLGILAGLFLAWRTSRSDEWQIVNSTHGNVNLCSIGGEGTPMPFAVVSPGWTYYLDDSVVSTLGGDGLSSIQWADMTGGMDISSVGVVLGNGRVHWLTLLDVPDTSGAHYMGAAFYDQMTFTSAFFTGFGVTLVIGLYQWGKRAVEKVIAPSGGL